MHNGIQSENLQTAVEDSKKTTIPILETTAAGDAGKPYDTQCSQTSQGQAMNFRTVLNSSHHFKSLYDLSEKYITIYKGCKLKQYSKSITTKMNS